MKINIKQQEYYTTKKRNVQLLISENFAEKIVPECDSVRLLDQIIEEIDKEPLEREYNRYGRPFSTSLSTLLKLVIYGSMQDHNSSRKLEKACKRDINFIWLLNGEKAPSHQTICRFRKNILSKCGEDLFYQIVKKLEEYGEIKYEHLFVDGTKIEANANRYSFVWKKSTTKYEIRNNEKLGELLSNINSNYGLNFVKVEEQLTYLESNFKGEFVHGRGKRKTQEQRDIEVLRERIGRKIKYENQQETFKGRNSFSKTDTDATFMRMKEDHMLNGQLKPGYNLQLAVEGEYITGVQLSSERSDQLTLIPLLDRMEEKLEVVYEDVTADAGYESEENYTYFENKSQDCYIKPMNYERSKTRKFKGNMALRENMEYNEIDDYYVCKNGKKLTFRFTSTRKSKSGFLSEISNYECEDCSDCNFKSECTKAKNNRKIVVSKKFIEQRKNSLERITSKQGIILRMNRSIQVEGAFGVLKQDHDFRRFLHRGIEMVSTEFFIRAMAFNVNKLQNKIMANRTGSQLFEKNIA